MLLQHEKDQNWIINSSEELEQLIGTTFIQSFGTDTGVSPAVLYGDHDNHTAAITSNNHNFLRIAGIAPDARIMEVSNSPGCLTLVRC